MFKLLFGITVGAVLMYLFDPAEGRDRRDRLTQRAGSVPTVKEDIKATANEAKERAKSTISHAKDRVGETIDEARTEVNGLARSTQERVEAANANHQSDGAAKS